MSTVDGNEVLTCADATSGSRSTRRVIAAVSSRTSGVPSVMRAAWRTCAAVSTGVPRTATVPTPNTELNATSQLPTHDQHRGQRDDHRDAPPAVGRWPLVVVVVAADGQVGRRRAHDGAPCAARAQASRISSQSRYTLPMPMVTTRSPGRASPAIRSGTAS